jgi:regulator of RNase E activity RraA
MAAIDAATHKQVIENLRRSSAATVTSWLNQRGYRNAFMSRLTCVRSDLRLVGRARTMRLVPHRPDLADLFPSRDENPHRKAVEHIGEGEVLVIDAHGNDEGGILGDIMSARLKARGAGGLVVDGSLRDVWQIKGLGLPVYVRHVNAAAIQRALSAVEMDGIVTCAGCGVGRRRRHPGRARRRSGGLRRGARGSRGVPTRESHRWRDAGRSVPTERQGARRVRALSPPLARR